ncbi:MAG: DUF1549 domain-containing protein [Planctomycetaceae bacterium]
MKQFRWFPWLCFLICVQTSERILAADVDFSHDVVPILRQHCVACHGAQEAKGGFSLNSRDSFLESEAAVSGDAAASHFLKLVNSADPETQMPPRDRPRVSKKQTETLTRWVNEGMRWQDGFSFAEPKYEPSLRPRPVTLPPAIDGRHHPIDRVIDNDRTKRGLSLPEIADDATFIRRASLDLTGLLPRSELVNEFVSDTSAAKDERLVERLLADDTAYAEHWLSFWNDLLRNDYDGTGFITGGRSQITAWLYESLLSNKPYDVMTRELLAPQDAGSRGFIDGIKWRGDVSAGQTVEIQFAQSVAQSFLGINMKCASCHDSFIDQWKLSDAYALAAIYSERPLELHRCDKPTGEMATAAWLFPELGNIDPNLDRQERLRQLSLLMTHRENGRFARTIVNRLWCQLMGRGIVHPLDAMQTRPWNEDLLDLLANHLVENNYDLKDVLRLIATSRAYRSRCEIETDDASNADYVYAGPRVKRLTAEQFVDAAWQLTGAAPIAFDAPVIRHANRPDAETSVPHEQSVEQPELSGKWIWGDSAANGGVPPGGETLVFRLTIELPSAPVGGVAVITADNAFKLYIGGREIVSSDDWQKPALVPLHGRLKKGRNDITIVATNGLDRPNAAGLFFDSWVRFENGEQQSFRSDTTWRYSAQPLTGAKEGRLGKVRGPFRPVIVLGNPAVYDAAFSPELRQRFRLTDAGELPMVRASLLKADFLMRTLGRPNRDQIVTSRPHDLTMLEAMELVNGESFAELLSRGAEYWHGRGFESTDVLVDTLFREALMRPPTNEELKTLRESLGTTPDLTSIEDLLWSVMMLPEFFLIQ